MRNVWERKLIILQRSEGVSVVKRRLLAALLITMVGSTNVKIKGRAQCALL